MTLLQQLIMRKLSQDDAGSQAQEPVDQPTTQRRDDKLRRLAELLLQE